MRRDLDKLKRQTFDLLVIGGGINGAAIAHLAALRGLKTALLEKNDFASGTSSKSSKLMHGGIRYLENFQFALVREALRERHFHVKSLPNLVQPLPFIIPVYKGDRRPLWMMRAGVFLYDLLAGSKNIGRHRSLTAAQVLAMEPSLNPEGLQGGVLYYDALMDDVRVCLENVLSAAERGAVCANYLEVTGFIKENGRAAGVTARDLMSEGSSGVLQIHARRVVVCAGAWTNELLKQDDSRAAERVRPTKGAHLVIDKKISERALLIPARRDKRIFFVIPWKTGTMIGTTDTDFTGTPDHVKAEAEDLDYLIQEAARVFPGLNFSSRDIRISFAGLRPLLRHEGTASGISREHEIFESGSGVSYIAGGKYTTYRAIAEDFVGKLISGPSIEKFYGSTIKDKAEALAARSGVPVATAEYLLNLYGSRAADVLSLVSKNSSLGQPISPGYPAILAQLHYSRDVEMALTAEDVFARRLVLAYAPGQASQVVPALLEQTAKMGFRRHPISFI